jgi:hypothetical protein
MRAFYIRYILHPIFMLQVKRLPLFLDYAYLYIQQLQHAVHGALLKPDWIERAREELSK